MKPALSIFRRSLVALAVSASLAATTASAPTVAHAAPTGAPNIVTIILDDVGFSDLSNFGGEIETPYLTQIAAAGTTLDNFYGASTSAPARSILFTGKDNHPAGVGNQASYLRDEQIGKPGYEGELSVDVPTYPEILQNGGYYTMMTGKWHLGGAPDHDPISRGHSDTEGVLLLGDDMHYLSNAEGKLITGQPANTYTKLSKQAGETRTTPYTSRGKQLSTFPPNAYSSTFYTDNAIKMLDTRDTSKPFQLSVSYTAAHFPLQAPAEVTDKYLSVYSKGWDVLRAERIKRLVNMGLLSADAKVPERWADVAAWDSLSADQKKTEAKKMAIYAAMVEVMDAEIGRLLNHLKQIGQYDNTVFMIASDNGAAYFVPETAAAEKFRGEHFTKDDNYDNMGSASSYVSYGLGWSMVSNTPFNSHKTTTFEGGVHTSAILYYPQSVAAPQRSDCLFSLMDIAPTALDMAGVSYPTTYKGEPLAPMGGVSMAGLFRGNTACPERNLAWELDGVKGLRVGDWKLSQQRNDDHIYLYDLAKDPAETTDLSASNPAQLKTMLAAYDDFAKKNGVVNIPTKRIPLLQTNGATDASFTGGMIKVDPDDPYNVYYADKATNSFSTADTVDVALNIIPSPAHLGQTANIFAYLTHTSPSGEKTYYAATQQGLTKVSADNKPYLYTGIELGTRHFIPLATQKFGAGDLSVEFGYVLADGTKVSNKTPIEGTVAAKAGTDTGTGSSSGDTSGSTTSSDGGGGSFDLLFLSLLPGLGLLRKRLKK